MLAWHKQKKILLLISPNTKLQDIGSRTQDINFQSICKRNVEAEYSLIAATFCFFGRSKHLEVHHQRIPRSRPSFGVADNFEFDVMKAETLDIR